MGELFEFIKNGIEGRGGEVGGGEAEGYVEGEMDQKKAGYDRQK